MAIADQDPLKTIPPGAGVGVPVGLGVGVAVGVGLGVAVAVGVGLGVAVGVGVGVGVAVAVGDGVAVGVGVGAPLWSLSRSVFTICCMVVSLLKSWMYVHQKTPPILPG